MVILFDRFNIPEDIFDIIFATNQQKIVGKLLIDYIKKNNGEITKTEMSKFATFLHEGELVTKMIEGPLTGKTVKLSYNKRQFYDRILTPMKGMGLIDYDLYKKTYKVSSNFYNALLKIAIMWKKELEKESDSLIGFNS